MLWCLLNPTTSFLCRTHIYPCLPRNWTSLCTLVFLIFQTDILPKNQKSTHPSNSTHQTYERLPNYSLTVGLAIPAGIGTGTACLGPSIHYHKKLSEQVIEDIQQIANSVLTLQKSTGLFGICGPAKPVVPWPWSPHSRMQWSLSSLGKNAVSM